MKQDQRAQTCGVDVVEPLQQPHLVSLPGALKGGCQSTKTGTDDKHVDSRVLVGAHGLGVSIVNKRHVFYWILRITVRNQQSKNWKDLTSSGRLHVFSSNSLRRYISVSTGAPV